MGFLLSSLLLEDGDSFRLESGRRLALDSTPVGEGPQEPRLARNGAEGQILLEDGSGLSIEGMSPEASELLLLDPTAVFPAVYAKGAQGGPGFMTKTQTCSGGSPTLLLSRWERPLRRWRPGSGIHRTSKISADPPSHIEQLLTFYRSQRGSETGFLFRDPFDNSTASDHKSIPNVTNVADRQLFGAGDGTSTVFQLVKRYKVRSLERIRPITRFSADDVVVILEGGNARIEGTHFTLQRDGGQVTFLTTPPAGQTLEWLGTFHCSARFGERDAQGFRYQMPGSEVASASEMTLSELKEDVVFSDHKYAGGHKYVTMAAGQTSHALMMNDAFVQTIVPSVSSTMLRLPQTASVIDGGPHLIVYNGGTGGQNCTLATTGGVTVVTTLAPGAHTILWYHYSRGWLATT